MTHCKYVYIKQISTCWDSLDGVCILHGVTEDGRVYYFYEGAWHELSMQVAE